MWTQDMFGVEKPIIALLHLDALPGDPGYCGNMDVVVQHAREDLLALQDGGVDGILFANEFSLPYQPVADIAVVSAMAYIIGKLKDEISVPFGVNVVKTRSQRSTLRRRQERNSEEAASREHIWENMACMSRTAEKRSVTEKRSESKI